jgi:hypothetical protein
VALCGPAGAFAYTFDGNDWFTAQSFGDESLNDVLVVDEGQGLACGNGGALYRFSAKK